MLTGSSNRYGRAGTIPRPTAVGPHRFKAGLGVFANRLVAILTAVWIVKAGKAIEAKPWKTDRLTATILSRVGSDILAASSGDGPS